MFHWPLPKGDTGLGSVLGCIWGDEMGWESESSCCLLTSASTSSSSCSQREFMISYWAIDYCSSNQFHLIVCYLVLFQVYSPVQLKLTGLLLLLLLLLLPPSLLCLSPINQYDYMYNTFLCVGQNIWVFRAREISLLLSCKMPLVERDRITGWPEYNFSCYFNC